MSNKYDRQLRLWGSFGQNLILSSKILLINAETSGCETLKNLILSGIGHVTIIDENDVNEGDLESNFFLTPEDMGKPRASVLSSLLELNPEVKGDFKKIRIDEYLEKNLCEIEEYQSVIACNLLPSQEFQLSNNQTNSLNYS